MDSGLTSSQAKSALQKHGKNVLKAVNPNPWWKMLLSQFQDVMVMLLMVSALIAVAFGYIENKPEGITDGLVIFGIIIINAIIGFYQEFRTEKALEALQKLVSPQALVIRDGKKMTIDSEQIVPGDLVVLAAGDKIVADGILLKAEEMKVDESALTGESVPVHRKNNAEVAMGTTVVSGVGMMRVQSTGMSTKFGRIAQLTTQTQKDSTPLQREMTHIGVVVTKVTLVISAVLILVGVLVQGKGFLESLLFGVSVAVAAVPEGLPATLTVALALGVQKMVKKRALVKQLSSVETLGSTTVICSDKTGTLTTNQMTVRTLLLGSEQRLDVTGSGYDPNKGWIQPSKNEKQNLERIRQIASQCNDAELQKKNGRYKIIGDPTEGALQTLALKAVKGQSKPELNAFERIHEFPFDSTRKMMSIAVKASKGHELWTKGSPDAILDRSTHILRGGKKIKLTAGVKKQITEHYQAMAEEALRVIAFSYRSVNEKQLKAKKENLEKEMVFVGLAGMIDPPRNEVKNAVKMCYRAGIRTIVITGDYGTTAKAIAQEIGIAHTDTQVILGEELDTMSDKALDKVLKTGTPQDETDHHLMSQKQRIVSMREQSLIFSRVNPEHKRRIVDRLKAHGEIVAVTGDGVNDAPALKRADLGIAMGITGTEVSKETANMVLLDDSFASIVTAIQEGRKIYSNIKKFTYYVFSSNIGELMAIFSAIIFQTPAPLTASLILAIDLGTDIFPGIALGVDHAEPNIMEQAPRDQKQRIMNRRFLVRLLYFGFLISFVVVGLYWWKLMSLGWTWGQELTMQDPTLQSAASIAFASLVFVQLFNAFNARSELYSVFSLQTLWQLWAAVISSSLLVAAIIHIPLLQELFKTTNLSLLDWILVVAGGAVILLVEEIRKAFLRHRLKTA